MPVLGLAPARAEGRLAPAVAPVVVRGVTSRVPDRDVEAAAPSARPAVGFVAAPWVFVDLVAAVLAVAGRAVRAGAFAAEDDVPEPPDRAGRAVRGVPGVRAVGWPPGRGPDVP